MCRRAVKLDIPTNQNVFEHKIEVIMPWQICIEVLVPVWIQPRTSFLRTSFEMLKKGSVQAHEAGMFCSRDVEVVLIKGYYAQTILFLYKRKLYQTNKKG